YMDDFMHLVGNARVMEGEMLFSWRRLLPYLAYFLIYKVAGFSPFAFHLLNLTIHLTFSLFVLRSMRDFERYLLPFRRHEKEGWISLPLLVALVFVCHPLGSEPVNYARCTPILLVGAFSYLAGWATMLFICGRDRRGVSAAVVVVAVAGATFSKDPGLIHALGTVAVVAWFCRGFGATGESAGKRWPILASAMCAVVLASPAVYLINVGLNAVVRPEFIHHALTHGRVFWMYVQRMLLPVRLSVDHYIQWTNSWQDWPALIGMLGIVVLIAVVLVYGKRNRLLAIAVCLTAFHLLLRMGYVIGHEMMVEYRTYPSLPWLAVLFALLIVWLSSRLAIKPELVRICTVAFVLFLGLLSISRSILWAKPSALARDALRQYPDNNRARGALMKQLLLQEQYDEVGREHQAMLDSVRTMTALNSLPNASRRYDAQRLIGDWTVGEVNYAPALVKLEGAEAALAHLDRTIDVLRGESSAAGEEVEAGALKDLIELRERVRKLKQGQ
ncbi:MAG: hypothetical protein KDN22_08475, partial [Verrucomicrobiae bacterium]|nr:hypothetical protein [Verrucomicrobiae bacterium]